MRTTPLFAALLLALGGASSAQAQQKLPDDWNDKVQKIVQSSERAGKVVDLGRLYDTRRQQAAQSVQKAQAKMREVFLAQGLAPAEKRIALQEFRDDRRKAAFSAFDPLLKLREVVSSREWDQIWPKDYFAFPVPDHSLPGRIQTALPSVVTDPMRKQQALDVAKRLVESVNKAEAARKKQTGRLERLMRQGDIPRDEFIESVGDLEKAQEKLDDEFINEAGQLQKVLSKEEWAALTAQLGAAKP
jgi:hypothetical protein